MLEKVELKLKDLLKKAGVTSEIEFSKPPKPEMGDIAFGCFDLAKEQSKNPNEVAKELAEQLQDVETRLIASVQAFGPYVNFFFNTSELAKLILEEVNKKDFGVHKLGKDKKIMIEFAHPNTHKAFHIGHLRNITTGESIVRILENDGYQVVRANYQGDVGMHIAKCLYGIKHELGTWDIDDDKFKTIDDKVKFLGQAYAYGGTVFEEDENAKEEIIKINDKIYSQTEDIKEVYKKTRQWSLEYFDKVYKRVGSHFDRLYFESEVFERAIEIVRQGVNDKIFRESDGAIIFEGSKYKGLHDRVFINSKGFPTYEAKDLALAEKQFAEYNPNDIYHVVAREQSDYFKVIFKAQEFTLPASQGKQHHLVYGWVSLKDGKMSSRTGKVVLGEWLLDEVKKNILKIMDKSDVKNKVDVAEKVAISAVKYSFLKTGIANDMQFDMAESISTTGDSGPYLLYIVARIKSILKKSKVMPLGHQCFLKSQKSKVVIDKIALEEKELLIKLSEFDEVTSLSAQSLDPSKIARYLFELAQAFNSFYENCPVLKSDADAIDFRLFLIEKVEKIMSRGLYLLGIETVDAM